ncbi:MAG: ATP-dependent zinc metalloprotease FtsH [Alphaproteobacteria bacterium]|nr:MAG: ATP-dependent zinc metalloprotease FtsH [Alphaproteobacteria bacterium]
MKRYDQMRVDLENKTIQSVEIDNEAGIATIFPSAAPTSPYQVTIFRNDGNLLKMLQETSTPFSIKADNRSPNYLLALLSWLPIILMVGAWVYFIRQMNAGGNGAMGFGKSRAKMLNQPSGRVLFADVAGADEAKEEVQEIVDFLRDPRKFQRLGGRIPKGVLLIGPPGTGKTLLGRAIAGEANVPFFSISGSDFVEMFVGVGASRVRDMFEQAKKNAPCIVFVDEIDAVGRHRGAGHGGGNDEREQTLNQLLVEMDGFESNEGVILLAATNRPDVLDPALIRPGRFDRQVTVPLPDVTGRAAILKVHLAKITMTEGIDPHIIARGTPGFSGADLANLVNEAALLAARRNKRLVTMAELEEAKDKVLMGPERRSTAIGEEEKKLTAYHEAGHAITALHVAGSHPIHKATIIPRGRSLGMVMRLPEKDRYSETHEELIADLVVAMGGRVAEEMIFGKNKVTTGASSDIQMATRLAQAMVTEWGMSKSLGPLNYSDRENARFYRPVSDRTSHEIENEVRALVEDGHKQATAILKKNKHQLETLAQALIEFETLSGSEINDLLTNGQRPSRLSASTAPKESERSSLGDILKNADKKTRPTKTADAETKKPTAKRKPSK